MSRRLARHGSVSASGRLTGLESFFRHSVVAHGLHSMDMVAIPGRAFPLIPCRWSGLLQLSALPLDEAKVCDG